MFKDIQVKIYKYIALILLLIVSNAVALPAVAAVCRNYHGQHICIVNINRSAKNYWEYKASITIDGEKRPLEVYNCRHKFKLQQDGTLVTFQRKDPGEFICSFFKNTSYGGK
ncbi:hypothetical protein Ava_1224 [Trichormus variabilis ATCC 29413]|uniref:Uncharacterized protein n=2 Tax=Anabaena variabilis TaxID=264691 RepID=Q3MDT8_TRIV2|nr:MULTISPECIES: hypothetical protein [Nostocaceae]MBD2383288.1 hypothetical protein [Trichormus variabilis FACHB-319]ABA20848.1 hypothetical protein Ava_1224 [Trichormus variabilis ATCC 29413]MBC1215672.1 hypothetical protein [Trichormus variabilis ARAD]MBC1254912.1 hypothetical protein [Trichormus variabilis V5]MBC1266580.1 hypothetical protein [Trichormus variabilis FSR]